MAVIYYDSRTGNVNRFVDKIQAKRPDFTIIKIAKHIRVDALGHLVTYTDRDGEIPPITEAFIQINWPHILSVSSSGNRNWGKTYGMAARLIAENYGIPLALVFELSGLDSEIDAFIQYVEKDGPIE